MVPLQATTLALVQEVLISRPGIRWDMMTTTMTMMMKMIDEDDVDDEDDDKDSGFVKYNKKHAG